MITLLKTLGKDNSGASMVLFSLLAGTLALTYIVGTGATDCFCFRPDTANFVSLNTVERLFGTMIASL